MNEFGTFDIDSNSISNEIEVHSLINGCVCCDLKQELVYELKAIALKGDVDHHHRSDRHCTSFGITSHRIRKSLIC